VEPFVFRRKGLAEVSVAIGILGILLNILLRWLSHKGILRGLLRTRNPDQGM